MPTLADLECSRQDHITEAEIEGFLLNDPAYKYVRRKAVKLGSKGGCKKCSERFKSVLYKLRQENAKKRGAP